MVKKLLFTAVMLVLVAAGLLSCSQPLSVLYSPSPTPAPIATPVTTLAPNLSDVEWLAKVIASEAGSVWDVDHWVACTDEERAAVGWTLINRLNAGTYGLTIQEIASAPGQYAHNQSPTPEISALAWRLLGGQIPDPTAGATHFFSPISMPKEGESTTGFDVGGGLHQVSGLPERVYFPSWTQDLVWVGALPNIRSGYFMFYKPSTTLTPAPTPTGLANSPWPMLQHDLQHTGRSSYSGPSSPLLRWSFTTGERIHSSPAIDTEGTIYVGSDDGYLYAINPNGNLKWRYQTGGMVSSSPALGSDGTIYVGSHDDYVYAINTNGNLKWRYETGGWILSSPAIAPDGTIYVGSQDNNLYALNPNGSLKWHYATGGVAGSSPAIGTDGTIYIGSDDGYLYAINPNGYLRWRYLTAYRACSPSIGADGSIYVGSSLNHSSLYVVDQNGHLKWSYDTGNMLSSTPALAADGTIYVSSWNSNIYSFSPNGILKWYYTTGSTVSSSPIIGADGTIYVGSYDTYLYAINPDGTVRWRFTTGGSLHYGSPAIGADGTIYVGSENGKLYAIGS